MSRALNQWEWAAWTWFVAFWLFALGHALVGEVQTTATLAGAGFLPILIVFVNQVAGWRE